MDALTKWLDSLAENPIVQIVAFLAMLVIRIEADAWHRRRAERRARRKKAASAD